jgi:hypothetical protein
MLHIHHYSLNNKTNYMNTTTFRLSVFVTTLLFTIMVASCKKDHDNNSNCAITMTNLAGTYKLTALKYKVNANAPAQDYLTMLDACERDDLINLRADGVYIYTDAGTSCTPNESDNGTWAMTSNILVSDGIVAGNVTSFDCHTLVVNSGDIYVAGDQLIFTMEKQ